MARWRWADLTHLKRTPFLQHDVDAPQQLMCGGDDGRFVGFAFVEPALEVGV
jgi:hypothetical protein